MKTQEKNTYSYTFTCFDEATETKVNNLKAQVNNLLKVRFDLRIEIENEWNKNNAPTKRWVQLVTKRKKVDASIEKIKFEINNIYNNHIS